jgi:hypothetical protein
VAAGAYALSAFVAGLPPFERQPAPFSRSAILSELPPGFPLPEDQRLAAAERGAVLPYHVAWTSEKPVSEVAGIYRRLPDGASWELMLEEQTQPSYRVRLSRLAPNGLMTHWATLDVSPWRGGSRISLDFIVATRISVTFDRTGGD